MAQMTETDREKAARVSREAEIISRAHVSIAAGLGIDDEALEAWLDELDANPDAPLPSARAAARRQ